MVKKRKKTAKQIRIEKQLLALKSQRKKLRADLKTEKKLSKKVTRNTRKVFKSTEKRRKQVARLKPKRRKPILPRIRIKFKQKKRNKKRVVKKVIVKRPKANLRAFQGHIARYHSLVRDFQEKRKKQRKKKLSYRDAMQSSEMKQLLKDLHKGARLKAQGKISEGNALLLKALKKTTRRDGVPDNIPVGESPK